jgi:hypothetical protein
LVGVALDARAMIALLAKLGFFFVFGTVLGFAHFRALSWNIRLLTGGAGMMLAIGLPLSRMAITVLSLALAALGGPGAMAAAMLGFLSARAAALRQAGCES